LRVTFVVAADLGGVIGRDGKLPWRLPADLRHFKQTTMGHPMIMGRRTWDAIGRALPGRRSIVLSRDRGFAPEGAEVAGDPDQALRLAEPADEVMVVGGEAVYRAFLDRCTRIHLTRVHGRFEGDARLPELDTGAWREVERREHPADERNPWAMSFVVLERV
jgi:dihydrofolate reductase